MGGFGIVFRYFSMTYCIYTIDGIVALFIDCFSKAKTKHWTKLSANWKFLVVDKLTHRNQSWKRTESFNNIYRIIWYEVSKTSETERQTCWERECESQVNPLFLFNSSAASSIWFTDRFLSIFQAIHSCTICIWSFLL